MHNAFKIYKSYKKITTPIKGKRYNLWVADTPKKKSLGLSPISELPRGWGMMFVYDEDVDHGFTMKDTGIPLKIIFLDKNFKVIDVFSCKPYQKSVVKPSKKYRYVVEI